MIRGGWLMASLLAAALSAVCGNDGPPERLAVTVGMSLILDTPADLRRIAVANGDLAEALAVNPREVLINGKAAGETSVILWQQDGVRTMYDLTVRPNTTRLEALQEQFKLGLPGQNVSLEFANDTVFLRGTVKDLSSAERAAGMAATLGKVVNLLRVEVPAAEPQILLHVRFADVDRTATSSFGFNLLSTGGKTVGQITTGQFGPATPSISGSAVQFTLSDALNIFLFRSDLNLGALVEALEAKNLMQTLAEPNILAMNGKPASFVSGGEFPFPVVQGGATSGAVTIQFREYGVRVTFLPVVTPRGTIRLQVSPEVSSLDYSNALQFEGFTIPALATRKVQTQVELENGQSFVIAGLLDNTVTDTLNKIPGIGDIPLLGKLFQSRTRTRSNSELMILVTPELVRPMPVGAALPVIREDEKHLPGTAAAAPQTPGPSITGPAPLPPVRKDIPLEEMLEIEKQKAAIQAAPQASPAAGTAPGGVH